MELLFPPEEGVVFTLEDIFLLQLASVAIVTPAMCQRLAAAEWPSHVVSALTLPNPIILSCLHSHPPPPFPTGLKAPGAEHSVLHTTHTHTHLLSGLYFYFQFGQIGLTSGDDEQV